MDAFFAVGLMARGISTVQVTVDMEVVNMRHVSSLWDA